MRLKVILSALLWFASGQAQAQQETLTLACKGTVTLPMFAEKLRPVSMGIIVNFTDRTVLGFDFPRYPAKIKAANDAAIEFYATDDVSIIFGKIDRVTGEVDATVAVRDQKTGKFDTMMTYELQCRPTQRMF